MAQDSPTGVYRYYDRYGFLLYVGITSRGTKRNFEHVSHAEWWPYVASHAVEHLPTRDAALAEEKRLIEDLLPPFNKQHNADHDSHKAAYLAAVANVDVCEDPLNIQLPRLGRRLPVTVETCDLDERMVTFRTFPDHFVVASAIVMQPNRSVVSGTRPVGRVLAIERRGMLTLITANVSRSVLPLDRAAVVLKGIGQSKPLRLRIQSLQVAPVDQQEVA